MDGDASLTSCEEAIHPELRGKPIIIEGEEYSIDGAFADITGVRRALSISYGGIAAAMKREVGREPGITVSAGLSLTKVPDKVASGQR